MNGRRVGSTMAKSSATVDRTLMTTLPTMTTTATVSANIPLMAGKAANERRKCEWA